MKVKYKTTFHNTLKGCSLYPEKMLVVEIDIPDNIINDRYEVVKYIELNTGHFVLDLLINEEESAESPRNEGTIEIVHYPNREDSFISEND